LAERIAADFLVQRGYVVRELNWRNKYCEIDIVAERQNTISFVEVKYRENSEHGLGMDYVTDRKLRQMQFAAEMWVQDHEWLYDYYLAALELSGKPPEVTNFLPIL
jgi:putative endonuclease